MIDPRTLLERAKALQADIAAQVGPPEEGLKPSTQKVILTSIVRNTRGYIESVSNQINGAYEMGWYDACAVMIRRLLETLIIECFEKFGLATKIQNANGDFYYLKDLIDKCLTEAAWNLSRNCKKAMPKLKDVGDKSAHSRRFNAHRGDIDPLLHDIRTVVQELIYLAALK